MDIEIWKDIEGFEGVYKVSNLGNVKSLNYMHRGYAQNLIPKENNRGYLWVELKKNGIVRREQIHRLVAKAFIPNDDAALKPFVNHKDENPKNNNVKNLEWCNNSYNIRYSLNKKGKGILRIPPDSNGYTETECYTHKYYIHRTKQGNCTRYNKKVVQRNSVGNIVRIFPNVATVARETGYHNTSITECCKGIRKTAYGYKWEFVEE